MEAVKNGKIMKKNKRNLPNYHKIARQFFLQISKLNLKKLSTKIGNKCIKINFYTVNWPV